MDGETSVVFDLMKKGNVNEARELLSAAPELVERLNEDGQSILFAAVDARRPDIAELALALGADPNLCDKEGWPVLVHAASLPDDVCTPVLLKAERVDINKGNIFGWTPLAMALQRSHWHTVRHLLKAGASLSPATQGGPDPARLVAVLALPKDVAQLVRSAA